MNRPGRGRARGEGMTAQEKLAGPQLAAIEAQLNALLRQQSKRAVPVDLPRPDFWRVVSQLLQSIELELAEIGRTEGWSVRAQTLSRRQANLRRTVADLTRHRLNAFVNHAALNNLVSTPFGDAAQDVNAHLVPIDWQRQDGAERAFHAGVAELIEQYKQNISWSTLQQGELLASRPEPVTPAGNAQLDDFIDAPEGLTGTAPPPVAAPELSDEERIWMDPDLDEEDRIALVEGFPEVSEHFEAEPFDAGPPEPEAETEVETGLFRIRILQDLPEPLIDPSGEEIELFEGDVHQCAAVFAETLIAAGFAEAAPLG